jgi:NAD(P)-dependent dehydrogenase (short-subunit alcohol dehydrogenase family)
MKVWFITGCSSGIGKGAAKAVLERGDIAVVTARNAAKLEEFVKKYPDRAYALSMDVSREDEINAAVDKVMEKYGHIDYLLNIAGYGYRAAVEEGDEKQVEQLFKTNFFGPVALMKKVLPSMRKAHSGGIVCVSSIAGARPGMASGYYSASKSALEMVTEALAHETAPLGIKVMIVEPGAFRTNFYDALAGTSHVISDYEPMISKRRKENLVLKHDELGDPDKGGRLIVDTILKDERPLRLLLGPDAVKVVQKTYKEKYDEAEKWKNLSAQTSYASGGKSADVKGTN